MENRAASWLFAVVSVLLLTMLPACKANTPGTEIPDIDQLQPGQGCSLIYKTNGVQMLGGNHEDYDNPLSVNAFKMETRRH